MKKWMKVILVLSLVSVLFLSSCKEETTEVEDSEFETVIEYMDNNGMDFATLFDGWIIAGSGIVDALDTYYIMDIRTGDSNENGVVDYIDGHVPGAVASSYGSIVTDAANSEGKPIIVVCYTGQSAGHAVMALRLSGYADAKVLKWGMSGWHSDFDSWTGNCAQLDHANWVTDPVSENQDYDEPEFDTDAEEGSEILTERVNALLTGGFKGVLSIDVLDAPANYFINNYWAEADVDQFGHIAEAHRISPLVLENLNPAETVVTYCWTGQTSSMITAYLTVLGYDAKSLKFGSNSMIWDDLTSAEIHNWSASADYDFEIGE